MGATFSRIKTWVAEVLTASDLNAEFNNIVNNLTPTGIDDEAATLAAMRATSDPYAGASAVQATSLQVEIQQIRYQIQKITGQTYWYSRPIVGEIRMYGGVSAPTGFLICDGAAISRTTYADLFSVLGTNYGAGDASTTFNLPDFHSRCPIGVGQGIGGGQTGVGLPVGGVALTAYARGGWTGEDTHTLITSEMPAHIHEIGYKAGAATFNGFDAVNAGTLVSTGSTGGDGPHNNLPPVMAVHFIIKY